MIEEPPILTVRRTFSRPTAAQVDAFRATQTGFVVDALDGRGGLDGAIKSVVAGQAQFCGVAVTCHCGPADNLAAFGALDIAGEGDVIVAATDGFMDTAVIGDRVMGMARNRGVAAFVTDGTVRDVAGIADVGLPCFAAGVTPNSPVCQGPGTVGQRVVLGGVAVESGDIVVGDGDGVVVVPFARIDQVIERLARVRELEAELDAKVADGLAMPANIAALLAGERIKEIE